MKIFFHLFRKSLSYACLLAVLQPLSAQEEILLDRMLAVINGRMITQSDLREAERWRVSEMDPATGRSLPLTPEEALRLHLERLLARQEIENYPGLEVSAEEIQVQWQRWKQNASASGSPAEIPEESAARLEIREQLLYEKYIDLRFRRFIEIGEEEIKKYYTEVFCPEWKRKVSGEAPPLPEVQEKIRPILVEKGIRERLDRWIEELRQKAEIQIFPEKVRFLPESREHRYPLVQEKPPAAPATKP